MTFRIGLKAGGIGAIVAVILALFNLVPGLACCMFVLTLCLWVGAGALAGYFGRQVEGFQASGNAVKAGAIASALTALAGGLVSTIIQAVQLNQGELAYVISQASPEELAKIRETGYDPAVLTSWVIISLFAGLYCLGGPLVATALGALGCALMRKKQSRTVGIPSASPALVTADNKMPKDQIPQAVSIASAFVTADEKTPTPIKSGVILMDISELSKLKTTPITENNVILLTDKGRLLFDKDGKKFERVVIPRYAVEHLSEIIQDELAAIIDGIVATYVKAGELIRVRLTINGYDNDSRELFEIPEVCVWISRTFNLLPGLICFFDQTTQDFFVYCLCGPFSKGEVAGEIISSSPKGMEFSPRLVELFENKRTECFKIATPALAALLKKAGASEDIINNFRTQLFMEFSKTEIRESDVKQVIEVSCTYAPYSSGDSPLLLEKTPDLGKLFTELPVIMKLTSDNRKWWSASSESERRVALQLGYSRHPNPEIRKTVLDFILPNQMTIGVSQRLIDILGGDPDADVRLAAARTIWKHEEKVNCEYAVKRLVDEINIGIERSEVGPGRAKQALQFLVDTAPNQKAKKSLQDLIDQHLKKS